MILFYGPHGLDLQDRNSYRLCFGQDRTVPRTFGWVSLVLVAGEN